MSPQLYDCSQFLSALGATQSEISELLTYNENTFNSSELSKYTFPLEAEPHVVAWERYSSQAQDLGVFKALRSALVQLQFPIQAGISQTDNYRVATRKGYLTEAMVEATGLELEKPEALQLIIHQSLAGKIPVIIAGCRADFVSLVQALTKRNEPEAITESMGATIVAGFNNWERIHHYRQEWTAKQSILPTEADWQAEFQRLKLQKNLYQDCFIILSRGNYSAVSAADIGIDEEEWLRLSLIIRLEHECCHYFTRRVFGAMGNNMLDELIADYQGIVAANNGRYRADWFLRFIGLEAFPNYRQGGRLQNYRGQPPLSEGAFKILQVLVKDAAQSLEELHIQNQGELNTPEFQAKLLTSLTSLTLVELAANRGI
ncbi:hypothetical protein GTQ43_25470 [Nostoc sp. KVJ3]|uniref:DUF7005 family protein n=1 Tax=Nostoc sp. KVJ3 TaxID=457945 RepID=UPI002238B916|nr:hypothetical protein [Nostoc sp. KVJ3]MCW5317046.1 hypothetical protein [Nostoc sp. KVJ3]